MNRIFKRFKTRNTFLILFVLAYNSLFSQSNTISQAIDPHVFMDVDTWETHIGDLSINEVMHGDSVVWEMETLNKPFWEKEGVKWFRQEVILPKKFEGLDVVLHIHTSPSAEVYINGLRSFIASGYSGKGILSFAAKAGEKYSIQVKCKNGTYNSRFYNAQLVGMPEGYGKFISSFSIQPPGDGDNISQWKFKMKADDMASQIAFKDIEWDDRKAVKRWLG
jgi:hypothetical protein